MCRYMQGSQLSSVEGASFAFGALSRTRYPLYRRCGRSGPPARKALGPRPCVRPPSQPPQGHLNETERHLHVIQKSWPWSKAARLILTEPGSPGQRFPKLIPKGPSHEPGVTHAEEGDRKTKERRVVQRDSFEISANAPSKHDGSGLARTASWLRRGFSVQRTAPTCLAQASSLGNKPIQTPRSPIWLLYRSNVPPQATTPT